MHGALDPLPTTPTNILIVTMLRDFCPPVFWFHLYYPSIVTSDFSCNKGFLSYILYKYFNTSMEIKGILNRICRGGIHKKVPVLESMEQDWNKKEILRKLDIFLSPPCIGTAEGDRVPFCSPPAS